MNNDVKPTIDIISKISGFSPATVSNALNKKQGVNKKTADKIIEIAKKLGYISDSKINKIYLIIYRIKGSIIIDNTFFSRLIAGVENQCIKSGIEIYVTHLDTTLSTYKEDLDSILSDKTAGIILLGSELVESEIPKFMKSGQVIVLIDYWLDDANISCITSNGYLSAKEMTRYIIGKGHTEIGYLKCVRRIFPFRERERGIMAVLANCNLTLEDKYIFNVDISLEDSYKSMKTILATNPKLPSVLIADNDVIALGCMRALREFNINIPEDVSIVGYDNIPMGEISSTRLTTTHVETEWVGRLGAKEIIERSEDPDRPKMQTLVSTKLIERNSVKDLNV